MKESGKLVVFFFFFDNKGHFRKIKCFISFFSICRLSLDVGFKYETYEGLLSIFGLNFVADITSKDNSEFSVPKN